MSEKSLKIRWDSDTESYHRDLSSFTLDERIEYHMIDLKYRVHAGYLCAIVNLIYQLEELLNDN